MAWEATSLDLLERAGIRTPERRLTHVGDRSVLILRRFDRSAAGDRISYISAMTALRATDGDSHDYAEIAEAIRDLSLSPRADHHELFDRVVASVALGNTDDHLRNHGFLAERGSWTLSPVFDVNPTPDLWRPRSTTVMGASSQRDEAGSLLALADTCSLTVEQARDRIIRVVEAMFTWRDAARRNDIRPSEITMMAESIEPRLKAVAEMARG